MHLLVRYNTSQIQFRENLDPIKGDLVLISDSAKATLLSAYIKRVGLKLSITYTSDSSIPETKIDSSILEKLFIWKSLNLPVKDSHFAKFIESFVCTCMQSGVFFIVSYVEKPNTVEYNASSPHWSQRVIDNLCETPSIRALDNYAISGIVSNGYFNTLHSFSSSEFTTGSLTSVTILANNLLEDKELLHNRNNIIQVFINKTNPLIVNLEAKSLDRIETDNLTRLMERILINNPFVKINIICNETPKFLGAYSQNALANFKNINISFKLTTREDIYAYFIILRSGSLFTPFAIIDYEASQTHIIDFRLIYNEFRGVLDETPNIYIKSALHFPGKACLKKLTKTAERLKVIGPCKLFINHKDYLEAKDDLKSITKVHPSSYDPGVIFTIAEEVGKSCYFVNAFTNGYSDGRIFSKKDSLGIDAANFAIDKINSFKKSYRGYYYP